MKSRLTFTQEQRDYIEANIKCKYCGSKPTNFGLTNWESPNAELIQVIFECYSQVDVWANEKYDIRATIENSEWIQVPTCKNLAKEIKRRKAIMALAIRYYQDHLIVKFLNEKCRFDKVEYDNFGDPELIYHFWSIRGQCDDIRDAVIPNLLDTDLDNPPFDPDWY